MGTACNVENMELFVDALFSGEYEQGKGALRQLTSDTPGKYQYCCLGVATDVAIKAGIPEQTTVDEDGNDYLDNMWENGYLPSQVQKWLGIDNDNPILDFRNGNMMRAGSANDDFGRSFPQIGDAFRRTYLTGEVL